jgi:biopolymer transport protein ExbD
MKIETEEPEEIEVNMTAMIDIVFQLLIFFIMTFNVAPQEGDFNIKMPLASQPSDEIPLDEPPELIRIALRSGEEGKINTINVDDDIEAQTFGPSESMFIDLTNYIEQKLAADGDPESESDTEVEFDIDFDLRYRYTVDAIEAVSGKVIDGKVKKLIEKIKFKNNSNNG